MKEGSVLGLLQDRSTNPFDNEPPDDMSFSDIRQQQQQIIRGKLAMAACKIITKGFDVR